MTGRGTGQAPDPELVERARQLADRDGHSVRQVAELLHLSSSTAHRYILRGRAARTRSERRS